jgi:hypothetical protein
VSVQLQKPGEQEPDPTDPTAPRARGADEWSVQCQLRTCRGATSPAWDAADITIRSDGDGRTVQAYITPFDNPTEIRDADGHYQETIGRTAFTKTLTERGLNFAVLYNHGRTFDGRTDGALMVPIGVPKLHRTARRGACTPRPSTSTTPSPTPSSTP